MAVDVCAEYDLLLAAEDFAPVLLAAAGAFTLAQLVSRDLPAVGRVARVGAVLITLGGLGKAVWKLLIAGPCVDVTILDQALFPLLATGFLALSWTMLSLLRGRPMPWWSFALVLGLGIAGALAASSTKPLLGVAALGALATAAYGVRLGQRDQDRFVVWGFIVYALATLVLPPLAARPDQISALQWSEQLTNTAAQALFAYAAWRLLSRTPAQSFTVPDRTVEAHS